MKKKLVKVSLSTLALSMVLAGCGSKEETQSSTSSTAPVSSATTSAPVEFSWLQMNIPGNNTITQQYVEKMFNVKIKPIGYDRSNWQQQINIKLASGEKPDLFGNTDLGFGDFLNYQKQGLIGEISVDTIRKYAPNYSKMIDDFDKSAWEVGMIDGKNYGIPKFYSEGGSPFMPAYNEAWLKKIGYNAPPKTLAELDDVLTKFRNNDPDGNGKKDTYGLSARGKDTLGSNQIFNTVFAAHGARPAGWILVDGKVQLGLASEQAREAYKVLNKWYKDGIIDPEFVTDDYTSNRAKFASGKIGMFDQGQWTAYHKSGLLGLDAQKSGVSLAVGTPVIGPAGKMLGIVQGFKQSPYALGADTVKDEKKVEAILKIIDKTATDKEVYMRTTYGELGVHYDMVDGGPVMKAEYADVAKASASIGTSSFVLGSNPVMVQYEYPSEKQAFKEKTNDKNITLLVDVMQLKILPSWDANKAALEKMIKEYQLKFIVGEVDLDKGFDNYVAELNKIGLDKATAEANEIYAKTMK